MQGFLQRECKFELVFVKKTAITFKIKILGKYKLVLKTTCEKVRFSEKLPGQSKVSFLVRGPPPGMPFFAAEGEKSPP